jgi:hypothetical protein
MKLREVLKEYGYYYLEIRPMFRLLVWNHSDKWGYFENVENIETKVICYTGPYKGQHEELAVEVSFDPYEGGIHRVDSLDWDVVSSRYIGPHKDGNRHEGMSLRDVKTGVAALGLPDDVVAEAFEGK